MAGDIIILTKYYLITVDIKSTGKMKRTLHTVSKLANTGEKCYPSLEI
jgi:hypothetical protein